MLQTHKIFVQKYIYMNTYLYSLHMYIMIMTMLTTICMEWKHKKKKEWRHNANIQWDVNGLVSYCSGQWMKMVLMLNWMEWNEMKWNWTGRDSSEMVWHGGQRVSIVNGIFNKNLAMDSKWNNENNSETW